MYVFGVDPGKQNTAYALLRVLDGYPPVYVTSSPVPMFEAIPIAERIPHWHTQFATLLRALVPNLVCLERFVPRPGKSRGAPAEVINLYLGTVVAVCRSQRVPYALVMPSVHKTYFSRFWGTYIIEHLASPHEADAVSLAIYGCHKTLATLYP